MAKRKRPKHESELQRLLRLKEEGKVGFLPHEDLSRPCPCPKRNGPQHPHPNRPGMVGFGTCRGCRYFEGILFTNYVCCHPKARETAARWLAEAIKAWEEGQARQAQLTLF